MTFLPIVGRELRAAARRPGTYWLRVGIGAQAGTAGLVAWGANFIDPKLAFGLVFLWGLGVVALIHCLFAGRRLTADSLSSEKRDGTLGLLFLTDLKGYDVVIGKLAATSLAGFYGVFAIFPALAVPLLLGGMDFGEL